MDELRLWREQQMRSMKRDLESLFVRLCYDFGTGAFLEMQGEPPLITMRQDKQAIYVIADVAGLDPATLEVAVEDDTLALKGRRVRQSYPGNREVTTRTSFFAKLRLPAPVDPDGATAAVNQGRLEITLPRPSRPRARRIPIQQD